MKQGRFVSAVDALNTIAFALLVLAATPLGTATAWAALTNLLEPLGAAAWLSIPLAVGFWALFYRQCCGCMQEAGHPLRRLLRTVFACCNALACTCAALLVLL